MGVNTSLASDPFQKNLAFGQMAETLIAKWLLSRGNAVLPIYDVEYNTGKGPRLFGPDFQAAAPDLYVWGTRGAMWCEAKHKSVFTWFRVKQKWQTGIDIHHWKAYQTVAQRTGSPVWLLFLHRKSTPDKIDAAHPSCPAQCPVGLFGQEMEHLLKNVDHCDKRGSKYGMVYWNHESLTLLERLDKITALEC